MGVVRGRGVVRSGRSNVFEASANRGSGLRWSAGSGHWTQAGPRGRPQTHEDGRAEDSPVRCCDQIEPGW